MKKFIAPVILLLLASALVAFLTLDFGSRSSFDADAYLSARAKIDSLEIALWNAQSNPEAQVAIRGELERSWEELSAMRAAPTESPEADGETAPAESKGMSSDVIMWIAAGAVAVVLCIVILVLILRHRKEVVTRQMEAVKAERFKEAKASEEAPTLTPRPRQPKRSIIADAEAYAAKKRETMAQQPVEKTVAPTDSEQKVAFEDENGVVENKILTGSFDKPTLRPTAKERITSAVQNLSNVFRSPRGISRDRTMSIRAQSRNVTGDPNLMGSSPLETTRFDRESTEKVKILQMSRRGFPASAIASQLKIPQEKVEAVIRDAQA